jgi:TonB family C-terminal domain
MTLYFFKMILCTLFFFFIYVALLEREKMHKFKRMYLLCSLVLSFVIPIIPLPLDISLPWFGEDMVWLYTGNDLAGSLSAQSGLGTEISNEGDASALGIKIDYVIIIKLLYLVVTITLLISLFISAIKLFYCVKNRPLLIFPDKKIVLIKEKLVPFSFGQYIYLNEEDYKNGLIAKEMIMHEQVHVRQRHSLDVMFIELLIAIIWFNPVLFLYRRAIKQNHEFLADDAVLKTENNITRYQNILISIISKTGSTGLASSLNYSTIKKRFIMMKRETSQRKARCRKLLLIPALLFAICIFSIHTGAREPITNSNELSEANKTPVIPEQNEETSSVDINNLSVSSATVPVETQMNLVDSVYEYEEVDNPPEFPGGNVALLKYIAEHVHYPENAANEGAQGRVLCQFIVNKDGSVSDVTVIRSLHPELDKESVQVLSELPKFKPGSHKGKIVRVYFSLPVRFQLQQ